MAKKPMSIVMKPEESQAPLPTEAPAGVPTTVEAPPALKIVVADAPTSDVALTPVLSNLSERTKAELEAGRRALAKRK